MSLVIGKKKTKLTCEQNPCQLNEQCVPKPNSVEGFTCVKERISVVEEGYYMRFKYDSMTQIIFYIKIFRKQQNNSEIA